LTTSTSESVYDDLSTWGVSLAARILTTAFQGGETYNRWQAYGQSKTANMLVAVELARRLGSTRKLQAFSLTPGPGVTPSHIGEHIDWNTEFDELCEFQSSPLELTPIDFV
jgi:NAD(P)-dependent dehydrogenase (short-subunit alcohol dehydrogenase family)